MKARITFKKTPNPKNFQKRSISFTEDEVSHVQGEDSVEITVTGNGSTVTLDITGKTLMENLIPKEKDGKKFLVFKY